MPLTKNNIFNKVAYINSKNKVIFIKLNPNNININMNTKHIKLIRNIILLLEWIKFNINTNTRLSTTNIS